MRKINLALLTLAAFAVLFTFNSCSEDDVAPINTGGGGGEAFGDAVALFVEGQAAPDAGGAAHVAR